MHRRTFHSLDALRGLAAIAVVFWHADWLVAPLRPQHGDLAVDLFFVMSGFVIAHAYEKRLQNGLRAHDFVVLRLIRLYPLYILGTMVGIVAAWAGLGSAFGWSSAAWAVAMLPTPSLERGAALYPYNGVAWSLLLEVLVNVVYAFTWRLWSIRVLLAVIGMSAALLVAATVLHGDADFGWTWRNLPGGVARVFFGFPMGVLIFRLFRADEAAPRIHVLAVVAATLVVLAWRPERYGMAFDLVGLLIATPLIVACAVRTEPPRWAIRPAAALGAASYAVYALHLPLLDALKAAAPRAMLEGFAPAPGLAFAAAVFALAIAADAWFDAPARRWLTRLAARDHGAARPRPSPAQVR
jgi:peptidoglycan/LPS O-acetylase OafA/YrhL